MNMKSEMLSGVAILAFALCPTGASAADAPPPEPVEKADTQQDIVITALRRSTSNQEAAAAITVVSGETLAAQNIYDLRGLQNLTPSARISPNNTATRVFIRGAGSAIDFYWIPETVAINFNGVYEPRFATLGAFFDIDNVQVLPGPQGVLYGRSAGGGAVLINTNRPRQENTADLTLEYGTYDLTHVEGVANVAVSDTLAVRAAANMLKHDGYESLGAQARDSIGVRLSTLWKPGETTSLFLWGNYYKDTGTPAISVYLPYVKKSDPWYVPEIDPNGGTSNRGSALNYRYIMTGGELNQKIGDIDLQYLASYLSQKEYSLSKVFGFNQTNHLWQKQYTHDLRLSQDDAGPLRWIAGLSWFQADSSHEVFFGPNFGTKFSSVRQNSKSAFAQLTFVPIEPLRIIAGGRYSVDRIRAEGSSLLCFGPCQVDPIDFARSWRHFDWKGSVEYDFAKPVMGYATVQSGYAPGTFNTFVNRSGLNKEVRPQNLTSYTAGVKSTLLGGKATFNVEGFDYHYRNFIIQTLDTTVHQPALFNAPRAHVYGAEVSASLRPSHHDTLNATLAYTHGRYGAFQPNAAAVQIDGFQMQYTPDWTATASWNHRFDLRDGGSIDTRVAAYLSSAYWGVFDHVGDTQQKAYTKTDLSLTYHPASDRWQLGAWIKNIENHAVRTAISTVDANSGIAFLEPPREAGITLGLHL